MRAVDTNLLVRLIARDDSKQVAVAEAFIARGAWVSHIVLVETSWVLDSVYELNPDAIATALDMLLNHRDLTVQDPDVVAAAVANFRKRPKSGFRIAWFSRSLVKPGTSRLEPSTGASRSWTGLSRCDERCPTDGLQLSCAGSKYPLCLSVPHAGSRASRIRCLWRAPARRLTFAQAGWALAA